MGVSEDYPDVHAVLENGNGAGGVSFDTVEVTS
jgi:hypothetical protein